MGLSRRNFIRLTSATASGIVLTPYSFSQITSTFVASDEFVQYDALGLAQLIKSKQISAAELLEIIIKRIELINPTINCIATPTFERARKYATHISSQSVFAGVPSLVKDMIDIGGIKRTDGSRLLQNNIPKKSVAWVEAFEASGLNIIGTTTVPEFASGYESELYGQTKNPWNLKYSCVASSSGAAAAVASGIVPLVHGTDGGGSNRFPSSACGTFGFKPSRGRMLSGESNGKHDLFKTNCAISRTVRDNIALFRETEDKNAKDFQPIGNIEGPSKKRLKIAFALNGVKHLPATVPSVKVALNETAKLLTALGHHVEEIDHPINGKEFFDNYRYAYLPKFTPILDQVKQLTGKDALESDLLAYWTATMIDSGRKHTQEQIQQGTEYFKHVGSMYSKVFDKFDVILSPVMPVETPLLGSIKPTDSFVDKGHKFEHVMSLCAPINPAGDCAMSVPLSFSKETGMPIGSMFHAPIGKDKLLFQLALELEQVRPWKDKWASHSVMYT